jgi:hypothetical protein
MIESFYFPNPNCTKIYILSVALAANGASSYRDAVTISKLANTIWDKTEHISILTDNTKYVVPYTKEYENVSVHYVNSSTILLKYIREFVQRYMVEEGQMLFTLSSHGYSKQSTCTRLHKELNQCTEYIKVKGDVVMDYEIFDALFKSSLHTNTFVFCLIDTCHSGTMLDMEYYSTDGLVFKRSKTDVKRSRATSICISACNDSEQAGEDISQFGGWGGKLMCQFFDYATSSKTISILSFYHHVRTLFTNQRYQRSHPMIGYNKCDY